MGPEDEISGPFGFGFGGFAAVVGGDMTFGGLLLSSPRRSADSFPRAEVATIGEPGSAARRSSTDTSVPFDGAGSSDIGALGEEAPFFF